LEASLNKLKIFIICLSNYQIQIFQLPNFYSSSIGL
jgi:hypothetical protein